MDRWLGEGEGEGVIGLLRRPVRKEEVWPKRRGLIDIRQLHFTKWTLPVLQ